MHLHRFACIYAFTFSPPNSAYIIHTKNSLQFTASLCLVFCSRSTSLGRPRVCISQHQQHPRHHPQLRATKQRYSYTNATTTSTSTRAYVTMRSKQQPRPSYRWLNKGENGKSRARSSRPASKSAYKRIRASVEHTRTHRTFKHCTHKNPHPSTHTDIHTLYRTLTPLILYANVVRPDRAECGWIFGATRAQICVARVCAECTRGKTVQPRARAA